MLFLSGIISHYHEQRSYSPIETDPNGDHSTTKCQTILKYDLYKNIWVKLERWVGWISHRFTPLVNAWIM